MSCEEQQQEELEVLRSIYDGDSNFKETSDDHFQYKYGEDGHYKSFIVEISWGDNYPEEAPTVDLDLFYNKHIAKNVQSTILDGIQSQIADLIGCGMTYTLFEWVRENEASLTESQTENPVIQAPEKGEIEEVVAKKKEKKEIMTKAQKRRHFDRLGEGGERPRGLDWVDLVKHLSQSGGQTSTS